MLVVLLSYTSEDGGAIGAIKNASTSHAAWLMISELSGTPSACNPPQKAPATLAAPIRVALPVTR